MNINDYRKAMDHINSNNELKERIMRQKTSQRRYVPVHRILASTLMAALVLTCAASVALAASPKLRTARLSFFRMEEREQVPGQTDIDPPDISQPEIDPTETNQSETGQPEISHAEIGGLVKARYVKMEKRYGLSGGLLNNLTWSDDGRPLLEAGFWEIRDNDLIPVQEDSKA